MNQKQGATKEPESYTRTQRVILTFLRMGAWAASLLAVIVSLTA